MKAVFDTNILIDHLNGFSEARNEFVRYSERLISVISWTEVMVGARSTQGVRERRFLNHFRLVGLHEEIATLTVTCRQKHRLKLPAAIIYATAQAENCLLVTRNIKDFSGVFPNVRVPYQL